MSGWIATQKIVDSDSQGYRRGSAFERKLQGTAIICTPQRWLPLLKAHWFCFWRNLLCEPTWLGETEHSSTKTEAGKQGPKQSVFSSSKKQWLAQVYKSKQMKLSSGTSLKAVIKRN